MARVRHCPVWGGCIRILAHRHGRCQGISGFSSDIGDSRPFQIEESPAPGARTRGTGTRQMLGIQLDRVAESSADIHMHRMYLICILRIIRIQLMVLSTRPRWRSCVGPLGTLGADDSTKEDRE